MVLNPKDYLASQGWSGPGSGFTPTSRSKPITVIQKKNQAGVGKDRDTSYPWWDDVFTKIASKITPVDTSKQADHAEPGSNTCQPTSHQKQKDSNLNLDVIQAARQNALRQDLYRRFLRGATIVGTVEDENKEPLPTENLTQTPSDQPKEDIPKEDRQKKSAKKLKDDPSTSKKREKSKSLPELETEDPGICQTISKKRRKKSTSYPEVKAEDPLPCQTISTPTITAVTDVDHQPAQSSNHLEPTESPVKAAGDRSESKTDVKEKKKSTRKDGDDPTKSKKKHKSKSHSEDKVQEPMLNKSIVPSLNNPEAAESSIPITDDQSKTDIEGKKHRRKSTQDRQDEPSTAKKRRKSKSKIDVQEPMLNTSIIPETNVNNESMQLSDDAGNPTATLSNSQDMDPTKSIKKHKKKRKKYQDPAESTNLT